MVEAIRPGTHEARAARMAAVVLLALACAAAYWVGSITWGGRLVNEGLQVDPARLDFGEVWEDGHFCWTVPLQNPTAKDLEIRAFESSCSCLSIRPSGLRVPAGGTETIELVLDLTHASREDMDLPVRDFSVMILPYIRDGKALVEGWKLHGRVRSPFKVSPPTVYFWDGVIQGRPSTPKRVTISGHFPLQKLSTKYDPTVLSVRTVRQPDERTYELEVVPQPSLSEGRFAAEVLVQAWDNSGVSLPTKSFNVQGVVQGRVVPFPFEIASGPKVLGDEVVQFVNLRSLTGELFELEDVENSSKEISVEVLTKGPRDMHRLRLVQRVGHTGHQSAEVRFRGRLERAGACVVPLQVAYYGIPNQ